MSNIVYTVQMPRIKSQGASFALTFFFGPFGAFYASALTGWLTLLISIVAAIATAGISILFTWPMTILWAALVVSNNNNRARWMQAQIAAEATQ